MVKVSTVNLSDMWYNDISYISCELWTVKISCELWTVKFSCEKSVICDIWQVPHVKMLSVKIDIISNDVVMINIIIYDFRISDSCIIYIRWIYTSYLIYELWTVKVSCEKKCHMWHMVSTSCESVNYENRYNKLRNFYY